MAAVWTSGEEVVRTYTGVSADVHFQAVVLAEGFVTVGTLVRTLT